MEESKGSAAAHIPLAVAALSNDDEGGDDDQSRETDLQFIQRNSKGESFPEASLMSGFMMEMGGTQSLWSSSTF